MGSYYNSIVSNFCCVFVKDITQKISIECKLYHFLITSTHTFGHTFDHILKKKYEFFYFNRTILYIYQLAWYLITV